ncbi:PREDICTED: E3 ubiquitin-protein ligase RMA2 [Camelina sativa]|uniref:E3 ubiquitin-protein ligase RMA n=1 Tax=Camelina sativa TaxID=90675 RepID=A0ABM0UY31_CAMSA|nr:PREDICTED: E3 ubiquitin-protein ligase RMA2 [Camelina sativa]XP_010448007.1 PREDICTED: E3 ubiquitin-protein ligase RMA2 [Camelina sativa]XP_010448008.1 PREDICTED: E3 ubiquitin-protein ligase RMA2 [Camelina sativa]XP_010448009.1 PREDICTED: E3 ubiquitin-protein ligase RMA2 [Camelina sativa]
MEIENEDNTTLGDSGGGDFDCNICLDQVRDPVVTLCGHLFCWPCIHKWTYSSNNSRQRIDQYDCKREPPKCPVCKSDVSEATLVPIYGRGQKTPQSGSIVPNRPSGPVYNVRTGVGQRLGEGESQRYMYRMPDPVMGVVCEMVHRRLFGDPSSSNVAPYRDTNVRSRRRAMQAEESLSRVYLFLLCFMFMCLFLF